MKLIKTIGLLAVILLAGMTSRGMADGTTEPATLPAASLESPQDIQAFYDRVRPALVAVQYQWESEVDRQEVVGAGVVVDDDGLVMIPLVLVADGIPDEQMKDFKILVPSDTGDAEEVDATFVGRDQRSNVAFVKPKDSSRKWTSIQFVDHATLVGEKLFSMGVLPKAAGYKAYLTEATVAANLRGEEPQTLVSGGGLASVGGVVFNDSGDAIGWVTPQLGAEPLLESSNQLGSILLPPRFFVPTRFFEMSLADPPQEGQPLKIPWMGVVQMTGVPKELAQFLGLKNQPAAQVGDVIADGPAAQAGLQPSNIIIAMNGKPLERGDLPEEIPLILGRAISRMNVGDHVTLTVLTAKGQPTRDVTLTLQQRPPTTSSARRYYASDLGFVAREAVFEDKYVHKAKLSDPAVVIDLVKRDGAAATAKLAREDLIVQLNGTAVTDLDGFESSYKSFRQDHPHDAVVLVVQRANGQEETLNIEPPEDAGLMSPGLGVP